MIEKFLELYVSAFLSFAPSAIGELYEFPAIFYTEAGEVVSFNEESFLRFKRSGSNWTGAW